MIEMDACSRQYYRPVPILDPGAPEGLPRIAGGWCRFERVEVLARGRAPRVIGFDALPEEVFARITAARPPIAGVDLSRPRLMGILNVTPDSFSDGGRFDRPEAALAHARALAEVSEILDVGGESTRPGAQTVPEEKERARVVPVIEAIRAAGLTVPISIDTRKASVARAALDAGADIVNDVSGLGFDPALAGVVAEAGAPLCLMHSRGEPGTMQLDPRYDDVLLDVYDHLAERIAAAEARGIDRSRILVDPGIGFGKTLEHNLALLRRLSLFHALGCPILLGVSRKRFIGVIGAEPEAARRAPGSIAVGLAAVAQGVQILRVHDAGETRQALALHAAVTGIHPSGEQET